MLIKIKEVLKPHLSIYKMEVSNRETIEGKCYGKKLQRSKVEVERNNRNVRTFLKVLE